jgi:hypothetical protein
MQSVVLLNTWKDIRPLSMVPHLHTMPTSWHSMAHQEYRPMQRSILKLSAG